MWLINKLLLIIMYTWAIGYISSVMLMISEPLGWEPYPELFFDIIPMTIVAAMIGWNLPDIFRVGIKKHYEDQ